MTFTVCRYILLLVITVNFLLCLIYTLNFTIGMGKKGKNVIYLGFGTLRSLRPLLGGLLYLSIASDPGA